MSTTRQTLAEAKRHLKINLSLLEQLKGNTPDSMLADFRLRYVAPLEDLIEHLQHEVRKYRKTDKLIEKVPGKPTAPRKNRKKGAQS